MAKLLIGFLATIGMATAAHAATILSENFESGFGVFTPSGQVGVFTGADYFACCSTTGNTTNHFVSFGSNNLASGSIATSFATLLGQSYTVSFDYGALGGGTESLTLLVAGQTFSVNPIANNNLNTTFANSSFSFLGTGGTTTLTIRSAGLANVDAIIDNISVTGAVALPEPSTWMMMLLGFGAIGFAMRRKATQIVARTI